MTQNKKEKKLSPKEIAWKVFLEDYEDEEIPNRFAEFLRDKESMKERFNSMAEAFNKKVDRKQMLEGLLLENVKAGHFDPKCSMLSEIRSLEEELAETSKTLAELKKKIEDNLKLIEKYKDWAEKRKFEHWKYLKAFDPEVGTWIKFKDKYNKVF